MIYFSVQSNLHYGWATRMAQEIRSADPGQDCGLIVFRSGRLTCAADPQIYESVHAVEELFGTARNLLFHPIRFRRVKQQLETVAFKAGDVLFLFTEYLLSNHYLAMRAKQAGARVFLVDEGIGTYVINNFERVGRSPQWKDQLLLWGIRVFNGFYDTDRVWGGPGTLPVMRLKDDYYDGYVLRYRFPIKNRTIRPYYTNLRFYEPHQPCPETDAQAILILGSYYDDLYLDMYAYLKFMRALIAHCAGAFRTVYFKFHYLEQQYFSRPLFEAFRVWMEEIGVEILPMGQNAPVEDLIVEMPRPPRFIAANFSTALLNAFELGFQPVFLSHLHGAGGDFETVARILEDVGYQFVDAVSEIRPDYTCGLKPERLFSDMPFCDFFARQCLKKA